MLQSTISRNALTHNGVSPGGQKGTLLNGVSGLKGFDGIPPFIDNPPHNDNAPFADPHLPLPPTTGDLVNAQALQDLMNKQDSVVTMMQDVAKQLSKLKLQTKQMKEQEMERLIKESKSSQAELMSLQAQQYAMNTATKTDNDQLPQNHVVNNNNSSTYQNHKLSDKKLLTKLVNVMVITVIVAVVLFSGTQLLKLGMFIQATKNHKQKRNQKQQING